MEQIVVLGCKGCGSAIAEIFLRLGDIDFVREEINYDEPGPARDRLFSKNPLGQVPTLLMPDGSILTETLSIANYVNLTRPHAELIPEDSAKFMKFQRWATFIVSALYPTWTYGDNPTKWVTATSTDSKAADSLRESTDNHRKKLWLALEAEVDGDYFLGDEMSAIDVYFAVMCHWRPRKEWFEEHCPDILAIAERILARPELKDIVEYHFNS